MKNKFTAIEETMSDAVAKAKSALNGIEQIIRELTDNGNITRLGGGCFAMGKNSLGNNWTAEHHDFKIQYEAVIIELRRQRLENVLSTFEKIISDGWLLCRTELTDLNWRGEILSAKKVSAGYRINLHADVINNLKTLLQP